jgi:hypothetical protein
MGMTTKPDVHLECGAVYRGDQLEPARVGVAVVYLGDGREVIGKALGHEEQKADEYLAHRYHQVTGTVNPDWDPAGAEQESELLFRAGFLVAQGQCNPLWNPNAEFKAVRDKTNAEGER